MYFRNLTNIEKSIKDIFLGDSYSKKPVFRNIRFDPRSVIVRQIQKSTNLYSTQSQIPATISPKNNVKSNKTGVVLKSSKNATGFSPMTTSKPLVKDEPEFNEDDLPVIQGSFKISKTEADITEKKTEVSETKVKQDKATNAPTARTTFKESSVTSAVYKIPGTKGTITKVVSPTVSISTTPLTTSTNTTTTTRSTASSTVSISTTSVTTSVDGFENILKFKGKYRKIGVF